MMFMTDGRQVCGYVLLAAHRAASSGMWTALSRMRTPWHAPRHYHRDRPGGRGFPVVTGR